MELKLFIVLLEAGGKNVDKANAFL